MALSMCMIALGANPRLSTAAIQADLAKQWPSLPKAQAAEEKDNTFAFRVGELDVIGGLMPAPMPYAELEEACGTSWLWKDAAQAMKSHATHLILTASGEADALARAKLLTQVTASIIGTCPQVVGVYWSDAGLVVQPPLFRDMATKILPDGLPLYVWLHFRIGKLPTGKTAGFTTGLAALGHMDFETQDSPEPPGELRERFLGLAGYVLENGPVIRDGDTIGEDANERIRVVYADSGFGQKGKVMRLVYSKSR